MRRKYIKINIEQFKIAKDKIQFIEDIGASNIGRHDWKRICTYPLPVEFIKKYAESINWGYCVWFLHFHQLQLKN